MIKLLTLEEAGEILRKTPSQMRWMIHAKKAPPHAKIGGRIMFKEAELHAWVEAQFEEEK